MTKKYELTSNTKKTIYGTLYQIRYLKDLEFAKKGELGGWIQSESNLSQEGNARVSGNARVESNSDLINLLGIGNYGITLARTVDSHILQVGCWLGTVDTLMAQVLERSVTWKKDKKTTQQWITEYESLLPLLRSRVASWTPFKSAAELEIEQLEARIAKLKGETK